MGTIYIIGIIFIYIKFYIKCYKWFADSISYNFLLYVERRKDVSIYMKNNKYTSPNYVNHIFFV